MGKVTFVFTGGCMDGGRLSADMADASEVGEAQGLYFITENDAVGKRFMIASPAARQLLDEGRPRPPAGFPAHIYGVVERSQADGAVTVRVRFLGIRAKSD